MKIREECEICHKKKFSWTLKRPSVKIPSGHIATLKKKACKTCRITIHQMLSIKP